MNILSIILASLVVTPDMIADSTITKDEAYKLYTNLVGGTWETTGKWDSGGDFHQRIVIETELTNNIFVVRTHDYKDSGKFQNGLRNFGVRAWDKKDHKMKFWEFDVLGGIITGEIIFQGQDIYHIYEYPDKAGNVRTMADVWIFVDKDTYTYKICEFNDRKPGKEFMSAVYKRK